jgi:Uncharacterized conserved protein (DUF2075).
MGETTNAAVEKLSPLKKLTPEQEKLVEDILAFAGQHITGAFPAVYTIYGDAGTGKSVVLSQLFDRLQRAARHDHASPFLWNDELLFGQSSGNLEGLPGDRGTRPELFKKDFARPTSLINQLDKRGTDN